MTPRDAKLEEIEARRDEAKSDADHPVDKLMTVTSRVYERDITYLLEQLKEARALAENWRNKFRPREPRVFGFSSSFFVLPWEPQEAK